MSEKICCFTGNRPQGLPFGFCEEDERCLRLKRLMRVEVDRLIIDENIRHFISGAAIGIDMFAAEIVIDLKKLYPDIFLELAVPCENQSYKWSDDLRVRYDRIVRKCDKVTLLQRWYSADCMWKRNKYMVDKSDVVFAVWNGKLGETYYTVRYALDSRKPIVFINPNNFQVVYKRW